MRAVDAKDSRTCFNISEDIVPIISLKNSEMTCIVGEVQDSMWHDFKHFDVDLSHITDQEVYKHE